MVKKSSGWTGMGTGGCGAYKYSEMGGKSMSSSRGKLTSSRSSSGGTASMRVVTHIAGLEGKGALQPSETFGGPKMSSAHGTNGQSKDNNMSQGGDNRVGKGCPGFKSGIPGEAHVRTPIAGHAKQPSGHKSKA